MEGVVRVLVACALLTLPVCLGDKLLGYAGFGHALVFDTETQRMSGFDIRVHPSSEMCDILHFPPIAPPTTLTDHVALKHAPNTRLFRLSGEMFMLMDGDTGSFTTYKCEGFRPFLPSLPCGVVGVGEAPLLAGTRRAFDAGRSRLMVYDSAEGEVSLHFVDEDVATATPVSKLPIGYNEKRLVTNIPNVAGPATIAVLPSRDLLVVFHKPSKTLKVFHYNWQSTDGDSLIGGLLHQTTTALPDWADEILGIENGQVLGYNRATAQYVRLQLERDAASSAVTVTTSSEQDFAAIALGGHACLIDDRHTCLATEGCGWCVTSQQCLHMAASVPCDQHCPNWCHEDSLACFHDDEAVKRGLPSNRTVELDPSIVSPRDVAAGAVVSDAPALPSDVDEEKVATGAVFEAPESNSMAAMNAGFEESEKLTGCNDNPMKREARHNLLAATRNMNEYAGDLKITGNVRPDPLQIAPPDDCVEVDENGQRVDLNNDAPLVDEGIRPPNATSSSASSSGGKGCRNVTKVESVAGEARSMPPSPQGVRSPAHLALTDRRMKQLLKQMRAPEKFVPPLGSTLSGHEMMNGAHNRFSAMNVHETDQISGHVQDESVLRPNLHPEPRFAPQQGEPSARRLLLGAIDLDMPLTSAVLRTHSSAIAVAVATSASVPLARVHIRDVGVVDGKVRVRYGVVTDSPAASATMLTQRIADGSIAAQLVAQGVPRVPTTFSEVTISKTAPPASPAALATARSVETLSTNAMETGCDEDGTVLSPVDVDAGENFMNGVAMAEARLDDDDGQDADGVLVAGLTPKQLRRLSLDRLVALMEANGLDVPAGVTKDQAVAALAGIVSPLLQTSLDARRFSLGMKSQNLEPAKRVGGSSSSSASSSSSSSSHGGADGDAVDDDVDDDVDLEELVKNVVAVDQHATVQSEPIADVESAPTASTGLVPSSNNMTGSGIRAPAAATTTTASTIPFDAANIVPNMQDGSFLPVSQYNADGVEPWMNPLGSILEDPLPPPPDPYDDQAVVNVVNVDDPSRTTTMAAADGQVVPSTLLEVDEGQLPDAAHPIAFEATAPEVAQRSIGVEVDPLVEYRDLEDEGEGEGEGEGGDGFGVGDEGSMRTGEESLDTGCYSSEDGYTGNSQPRIDWVGPDQVVHMQPMMSSWALYDTQSGLALATGVLPTPYRPVRRYFLGGSDNRYVEHSPITGQFKFFKCADGARFGACEQYAQGQWDTTVHTNDVAAALTANLVLLYNQDTGAWRVFNFDRDVSGNSDPFSTAMPPIAAGTFPAFADDEVVVLGDGTLLVHDPPTGNAQVFRFDADKKTLVGPVYRGKLTEGNFRATGIGHGRVVVFRPRTQACHVLTCAETGAVGAGFECVAGRPLFLHASRAFDTNPVLRQLLAVEGVSHPAWQGASDALVFVRRGRALRVSTLPVDMEGVTPGDVPVETAASALDGVRQVLARPLSSDLLLVVDGASQASNALKLQTAEGAVVDIAVEAAEPQVYIPGRFSPDGRLFAFVATSAADAPERVAGDVFVVEVDAVKHGHGAPALVRSYPSVLPALGPFSHDNRFLVVAVESTTVALDNNLEAIDTLSGLVVPLTAPPQDAASREPSVWDVKGAVFSPVTNKLLVLSNENTNFVGVQRIDLQRPARREFVLQLPKDVVSLSCDATVQRCAVVASSDGLADYHVFQVDARSGDFTELQRPFLVGVKAATNPLLISRDGTRLATVKDSPEDPQQLFMAKIVDLPKSVGAPPEPLTIVNGTARRANKTVEEAPRLAVVSTLTKMTQSRVGVPGAINNLPGMVPFQFQARDGTPITGFHFPPSLTPLYEDVFVYLNNTSPDGRAFGNASSAGTKRLKVDRTLSRQPPYVLFLHDGPKATAGPGLWSSFALRAINFLRTMGVGVVVPNVRGSAGFGKRFSLMDLQTKQANVFGDVKDTRDFVCDTLAADCANIGVFGEGYGGFAALESAMEFPESFKVAGSINGFTNVARFARTAKPAALRHSLRLQYGSDARALDRVSPARRSGTTPNAVLIVQSADDPVVLAEQAEDMVAMVRMQHKIVRFMSLHDEGHHVEGDRNRLLGASALVQFVTRRFGMTDEDDVVDDEL